MICFFHKPLIKNFNKVMIKIIKIKKIVVVFLRSLQEGFRLKTLASIVLLEKIF